MLQDDTGHVGRSSDQVNLHQRSNGHTPSHGYSCFFVAPSSCLATSHSRRSPVSPREPPSGFPTPRQVTLSSNTSSFWYSAFPPYAPPSLVFPRPVDFNYAHTSLTTWPQTGNNINKGHVVCLSRLLLNQSPFLRRLHSHDQPRKWVHKKHMEQSVWSVASSSGCNRFCPTHCFPLQKAMAVHPTRWYKKDEHHKLILLLSPCKIERRIMPLFLLNHSTLINLF